MKTRIKVAFQGTGQRLTQVRKMMNYSRRQMAAWLNIGMSTYYKNESEENLPGWMTLYTLQKERDISVDWLMFNKGPVHMKEKTAAQKVQTEPEKEKETPDKKPEHLKHYNTLRNMLPEMDELMETMANDPELRYDILLNYHRYKKNNRTMGQEKK